MPRFNFQSLLFAPIFLAPTGALYASSQFFTLPTSHQSLLTLLEKVKTNAYLPLNVGMKSEKPFEAKYYQLKA